MYTSALWHGGKVETLLFTCEPATLEPVGRVENYARAYCSSSSSKLRNVRKASFIKEGFTKLGK